METQNQELYFKETYMEKFELSLSQNILQQIKESLPLMDNPQEENDISIEIHEFLTHKLNQVKGIDDSIPQTEYEVLKRELAQTIEYNLDLQSQLGSGVPLLKTMIAYMDQINHDLQSEWDLLPEF